ncbi:MAG TPA: hypothetical protein VFI20_10615 [Terracidiphilus sp.]|nr:hypothetical protein [Terracidiphilus sp.]
MKRVSLIVLVFSLVVMGGTMVAAQEQAEMQSGPPPVMFITREHVKLGHGAAHNKTEGAISRAMQRANYPGRSIALQAISGSPRVLYIHPFGSFADAQKLHDTVSKDAALMEEFQSLNAADDAQLESADIGIFSLNKELSYGSPSSLAHQRFMEIASFEVRPGHYAEFVEVTKMYIDAVKKAGIAADWAMYHLEYGGDSGIYLLFSPDKSLADIDQSSADGKKFRDAMGEDGMKKLEALIASAIASEHSNLYVINPNQSYVPESWEKEDPGFWNPKK